ncbi:MAG: TonB-dependent receptor plug domain-containing protein, partial [Polyangiales bacterium]
QQSEGEPNLEPLATQDVRSDALSATVYRPATYLEVDWQATRQWLWVFGTRLDYFSEINSWGIDPRVTSIYSLSEQTRLKAGVGSFTQAPEFQESADDSVGNPALEPLRALHTGLGIEHDLKAHITLGAEGFYKHIFNRVVRNVDGAEPNFINDGLGRIYGLELSGRVQPKGRFFGFLSYTLSRSERNDRDEGWRLFDFDQTHIFTASGTYRLGRGWELGSTVRLVSGNPDTPVVGSVYDGNADLFIPINGPINSTRNPLFHRLDVRIEKLWRFQTWKLALYLDVQNAYNAQNREGVSYSFDYRESSDVTGLPIIPSLGIRGEL